MNYDELLFGAVLGSRAFLDFLTFSCVKPSESLVDEPDLQQHFTNESEDTQDEAYGV